jgi:hypothetical protein
MALSYTTTFSFFDLSPYWVSPKAQVSIEPCPGSNTNFLPFSSLPKISFGFVISSTDHDGESLVSLGFKNLIL